MYSKRASSARIATNWAMAVALLVALMFASVGPAFAATTGTISSIVPAAQGSALTYGTAGTASFNVVVTSTGTINNVVFNIAGLPTGATAAFNPKQLSFAGAQSKPTTLTVTTVASTPAVTNRPLTIGYKVAGKSGTTTGTALLTIGKATVGVGGTLVQDKVYDGNTNAVLAPGCSPTVTTNCASVTGARSGDVVWLVTSGATGTFAGAAAGVQNAAVVNLSLTGASSGNYQVPASVPSSATITKAQLDVKGANEFHYIFDPNPVVFEVVYNGFVAGEDASDLTEAPTCDVAVPYTTPGPYDIQCAGGSSANYAFNYLNTAASGGGVLTVSSENAAPTGINLSNSSVAENVPAGTLVGNLTTVDAESALGETYTYKLASGVTGCDGTDNASFQVAADKSNGPVALSTGAVFHYVTKASYAICVETNDGTQVKDVAFVINVLPSTKSLVSAAAYDGWVLQKSQTVFAGGTMNSTNLTLVAGDDQYNRAYRSILTFGTGQLPDNATIYSVQLKIRKSFITASNPFTLLNGLRADIIKPSYGSVLLQLTDWQQLPSLTSPGMQNAATFNPTPDSQGYYTAPLLKAAWQYINLTNSTQIRVHFSSATNKDKIAQYLTFYSGSADAASAPLLIISYSAP